VCLTTAKGSLELYHRIPNAFEEPLPCYVNPEVVIDKYSDDLLMEVISSAEN